MNENTLLIAEPITAVADSQELIEDGVRSIILKRNVFIISVDVGCSEKRVLVATGHQFELNLRILLNELADSWTLHEFTQTFTAACNTIKQLNQRADRIKRTSPSMNNCTYLQYRKTAHECASARKLLENTSLNRSIDR